LQKDVTLHGITVSLLTVRFVDQAESGCYGCSHKLVEGRGCQVFKRIE